MPRCRANNSRGIPCQAPDVFVDPMTGFCPAHVPGARDRLSNAGRKGGEATKRRLSGPAGLGPHELPALSSPEAAERWLEIVGRAVAEGRLAHRPGQVVATAVREWLKAHEAGRVAERLEELRRKLDVLLERGPEVAQ